MSLVFPYYFPIISILFPSYFQIISLLFPFSFPIMSLVFPYYFPIISPYCFRIIHVASRRQPPAPHRWAHTARAWFRGGAESGAEELRPSSVAWKRIAFPRREAIFDFLASWQSRSLATADDLSPSGRLDRTTHWWWDRATGGERVFLHGSQVCELAVRERPEQKKNWTWGCVVLPCTKQ